MITAAEAREISNSAEYYLEAIGKYIRDTAKRGGSSVILQGHHYNKWFLTKKDHPENVQEVFRTLESNGFKISEKLKDIPRFGLQAFLIIEW